METKDLAGQGAKALKEGVGKAADFINDYIQSGPAGVSVKISLDAIGGKISFFCPECKNSHWMQSEN